MYISITILVLIILSVIILKSKWPEVDTIYLMRLLLTIVFGFVLYIPVIWMLVDIFICTEEAKGTVFFDIDWNTECWDNIEYPALASFALVLAIPSGMYLRVKF